MQSRPDVMILDIDRNRSKSLRRILRDGRREVTVEEVAEVRGAREAILSRRPALVLLHSTFPYLERDGTGLLELIQDDFRNHKIGVMLVLPISGSLLYRSGYQDGMEMVELADDLITTDFTSDMIQSVVCQYLDRCATAPERAVEPAGTPEYAFVPSKRV